MAGPGGKRAGAGRKPGSPNKATQKRQAKVAATGITPLDLMIGHMRGLWDAADKAEHAMAKTKNTDANTDANKDEIAGLLAEVAALRDKAAALAKDVAPYIHPKLATISHTGGAGGPIEITNITRTIVEPEPKSNGDARHSNGEDLSVAS